MEINMALYTIGDLHLSFNSDKPMDVFGDAWQGHAEKLKLSFSELNSDDTVVVCGDLTWGISIEDCLQDFRFIDELNGNKIVLKGNHDFWWTTATKAKKFFAENGISTIEILNNNSFMYGDTAICGTRGWFYEEGVHTLHDKKIMDREIMRLEASLRSAPDNAEKLCFFHYPPRFGTFVSRGIIDVMEKYKVKRCWYGHIHGKGHKLAVQGLVGGIEYTMVSADYLDFRPLKINI